jgi:hypothetical protein
MGVAEIPDECGDCGKQNPKCRQEQELHHDNERQPDQRWCPAISREQLQDQQKSNADTQWDQAQKRSRDGQHLGLERHVLY